MLGGEVMVRTLYIIHIISIAVLVTLATQVSFAQKSGAIPNRKPVELSPKMVNSEGTDFWVCFMRNYREGSDNNSADPLTLELFITANNDARVEIFCDGINYKRNLIVKGGTVASMMLTENAQLDTITVPQRRAVHITSDNPISVYGLNRRYQSTDTYLALPVSVLGTEYRAMGYYKLSADLVSQIAVVATEDSTELYITPNAATTDGHKQGEPYAVLLRKGDVYQLLADFYSVGTGDLTGTLIRSNRKVAVFSGHSCGYVPMNVQACNHLVEQMPPVSSWGKHFYVGMLKGRSRYTLRVIASENKTKVFENTKLVSVLDAGEFYENMNVREHLQITADKPILVGQFSQGFKNGDSIGDPMLILVSPTQQFIKNYRIATPVNGSWDHYVNLVVPTESITTIRLDGEPIPSAEFEQLALSRYSIAQKKIDFGTHILNCEAPFGLYSYGFGYKSDSFDAYGNMGGQSFFDLEEGKDTIPPLGESKQTKDGITVYIRDDRNNDKGLASVKVLYALGLNATLPTIEEGAPQVQIKVKPVKDGIEGKMVFQAYDVAGNRTLITVCYTFDNRTEKYGFKICPDGEDCETSSSWSVGGFFVYNQTYHNAEFGRSGNIISNGVFRGTSGGGGYFGVSASRRINEKLALSGRFTLETIGGDIRSADTILSQIRLPDGSLVPFQEERIVTVNTPVLSLCFAAEYYPLRSMYIMGGARGMLHANNNITLQRRILQPENYAYSPSLGRTKTEPTTEMSSLTTFRFGFVLGIGFTLPITPRISANIETNYTIPVSGMISEGDGDWSVTHVCVQLGARFRLK